MTHRACWHTCFDGNIKHFLLSLELKHKGTSSINPLNAELNSIYHLLILLGDLTFMGTCIVSTSNKMQRYTVYLYLETALHVSGGTSTHHHLLIILANGRWDLIRRLKG